MMVMIRFTLGRCCASRSPRVQCFPRLTVSAILVPALCSARRFGAARYHPSLGHDRGLLLRDVSDGAAGLRQRPLGRCETLAFELRHHAPLLLRAGGNREALGGGWGRGVVRVTGLVRIERARTHADEAHLRARHRAHAAGRRRERHRVARPSAGGRHRVSRATSDCCGRRARDEGDGLRPLAHRVGDGRGPRLPVARWSPSPYRCARRRSTYEARPGSCGRWNRCTTGSPGHPRLRAAEARSDRLIESERLPVSRRADRRRGRPDHRACDGLDLGSAGAQGGGVSGVPGVGRLPVVRAGIAERDRA